MSIAAAALFLVLLSPLKGTGTGPIRVEIEAHDANIAKRLAQAQYGSAYRISDVRRINR